MTMTFRLLGLLLLLYGTALQVLGQTNLIANPSFEDEPWGTYGIKHWSFTVSSRSLCSLTTDNPHSGAQALQIITGTDTSITVGKTGSEGFEYFQVSGGAKYTFRFFYRGEPSRYNTPTRKNRKNLKSAFTWYGPSGSGMKQLRSDSPEDYAVVIETAWQEKTIEVTAPPGATQLKLTIFINEDVNKARQHTTIAIDDLSLVAESPKPSAPAAIQVTPYQREAELSWSPTEGASYELELGGETFTTSSPSYTLVGLRPDTPYTVQIRALKDGSASAWSSHSFRTTALTTSLDEDWRTPYLRTLSDTGPCPRTLALFYNELHSDNPTITYTLDGEVVAPLGHSLSLDPGQHKLQIVIEEDPRRIFTLFYTLTVN